MVFLIATTFLSNARRSSIGAFSSIPKRGRLRLSFSTPCWKSRSKGLLRSQCECLSTRLKTYSINQSCSSRRSPLYQMASNPLSKIYRGSMFSKRFQVKESQGSALTPKRRNYSRRDISKRKRYIMGLRQNTRG